MANTTKANDEKTTTATADPWDFTADKTALNIALGLIERLLEPLEAKYKEERAKVDQKALDDIKQRSEAIFKAKSEAFEKMMTAKADGLIASGVYLFEKEDRVKFSYNHFQPSTVNPAFRAAVRAAVGVGDGEDIPTTYLFPNIVHTVGMNFVETYKPFVEAKALYEALEKVYPYSEERDLMAGADAAYKAMEPLNREATHIRDLLTHIRNAEATNPKTKKGRAARAEMAATLIYAGYRELGWTTKPCGHCGHINDHQAKGVACRECKSNDDPCYIEAPSAGVQ